MSEHFLSITAIFNVTVAAGALLFAAYLLAARPKSARSGSAFVIPVFGNQLHIRYRRNTRWVEDKHVVPAFRLGELVVSYWPRRTVESEARYQD